MVCVGHGDDVFLQEHHTDLCFKSVTLLKHSSAHAAIFNPGGTRLTICMASKTRTLHFYSQIPLKNSWDDFFSLSLLKKKKAGYFLLCAVWAHLIGSGCWTKTRRKNVYLYISVKYWSVIEFLNAWIIKLISWGFRIRPKSWCILAKRWGGKVSAKFT